MALIVKNALVGIGETAPNSMTVFRLDAELMDRPEAQRARLHGVLLAKHEALRTARRLVRLAMPLIVAVLVVSFVHLWQEVSGIVPAYVQPLQLWGPVYHISNAALIISIDCVAVYLLASRKVLTYIGETRQGAAIWFFYVLTALLNGVVIFAQMPGLPAWLDWFEGAGRVVVAFMLAVLVPLSIAAIERAHHVAEYARLMLIVDIQTLHGLIGVTPQGGSLALAITDCPLCGLPTEYDGKPASKGVIKRHGCQACRDARKAANSAS